MAPNEKLAELSRAGVAVWLDDLSRDRIRSGDLQSLVDGYSVVGVTTNPTIFAASISGSDSYDDQVHAMAVRKVSVAEALRTITAADVRDACDLLAPVARRTGRDGRVSLEVAPRAGARHRRHRRGGRPPVVAGRPAQPVHQDPGHARRAGRDHHVHRGGHQRQRHPHLQPPALPGGHGRLPNRAEAAGSRRRVPGRDRVGRVLLRLPRRHRDRPAPGKSRRGPRPQGQGRGRERAAGLPGLPGGLLLQPLAGAGGPGRQHATPAVGLDRREEPGLPDTLYVSGLIAPDTVNTMPEKTLKAYADHGSPGQPVQQAYDEAAQVMKAVADAGVDLDDVFRVLEDEGVGKFADSWDELTGSVRSELENKK